VTHHGQFGAWVEPSGDRPAGDVVYRRSHSAYERWMEEQGIPIFRGIGVRDTRDVRLGVWQRRHARGAFLDPDGLEGLKGMYVLEVPAGDATYPEKHMDDEFFFLSSKGAGPPKSGVRRTSSTSSSGSPARCL
jgi:hypothetical protein